MAEWILEGRVTYRWSMGEKCTFLPWETRYPTKMERQRETTERRRAKALAASQELPDDVPLTE